MLWWAELSKTLILLTVDGWGWVPSLLVRTISFSYKVLILSLLRLRHISCYVTYSHFPENANAVLECNVKKKEKSQSGQRKHGAAEAGVT